MKFRGCNGNVERNTDTMKKRASQSSSFEFELSKNTDQPIVITLIKVDTCSFNFFVRAYHTYNSTWNAQIGDKDVEIERELNSDHKDLLSPFSIAKES